MVWLFKVSMLLSACLLNSVIQAQSIYKLWENSIQGNSGDGNQLELIKINNSKILAACLSASDSGYDKSMDHFSLSSPMEPWVLMIDINGNILWDRDFYYPQLSAGLSMLDSENFIFTSAANLAFYGDVTAPITFGSGGQLGSWVVDFNSTGDTIWNKRFCNGQDTINTLHGVYPFDLKTVNNAAYVLAVTSRNADIMSGGDFTSLNCVTANNANNNDILLYKVNPNDSLTNEWQRVYGGDKSEYPVYLFPIQNDNGFNGFLIGGFTSSQVSCNQTVSGHTIDYYDYFVIRTDTSGNIIWQQRYGGSKNDYLNGILDAGDGNFLLYGRTTSPVSFDITQAGFNDTAIWLVKIDGNGAILWDRRFGACNGFSYLGHLIGVLEDIPEVCSNTVACINTSDGGYLIASNVTNSLPCGDVSEPGQGYEDYWLLKLDSAGNKIWDKRFGGPGYDVAERVVEMSPGYYIVGGYSRGVNVATQAAGGDKSEATVGTMDLWFIGVVDSAAILASTENIAHLNLELLLYPNPTVKEVTIKIQNDPNDIYKLVLYDITGKMLIQQQTGATAKINMETFSAGIYIVEVGDKLGNKGRKKIVKW